MKTRKHSPEVYKVLKSLLGICSVCSMQQSHDVKKKVITTAGCRVFRTSKTSVTMICRVCGLHNTVTWRSLAMAIGTRMDAVADNEAYEEEYNYYAEAFEVLDKNVNIDGIVRHDMQKLKHKRMLTDVLNGKLI